MVSFSLFQRRQVWLPTLWGWFVLLAVAIAASVIAGRHLHAFLAPNEPDSRARVLVVEGWMGEKALDQAIALFQTGGYERLVTTGGPIENWRELRGSSTFAGLAADYLRKHGLERANVTAVSTPASAQDRTFLSAVMVREWAKQEGLMLDAVDLFSSGAHGRRSRMLFRIAFGPDVAVGVVSARPLGYDEDHWWRTSAGVKSVIGETLSLIWTTCCFHPGQPGSHEERWGGRGRLRAADYPVAATELTPIVATRSAASLNRMPLWESRKRAP